MFHVDRDGECGAERRIVFRHHRIEMQAARHSTPSGAQTMPEVLRMMNAIFLRRAQRCGDEEIALVLAVVVVGDDHDLAFGEGLDGGFDS